MSPESPAPSERDPHRNDDTGADPQPSRRSEKPAFPAEMVGGSISASGKDERDNRVENNDDPPPDGIDSDGIGGVNDPSATPRGIYWGFAIPLFSLVLMTPIVFGGFAYLLLRALGASGIIRQIGAGLAGQTAGAIAAWRALRSVNRAFHLPPPTPESGEEGGVLDRIGWGIRFYIASLPGLLALSLLVTYLSERFHIPIDRPELQAVVRKALSDPVSLLLFAVMVSVGASLHEELTFRGLLYTTVRARWSARTAVLVTAVLFALMHEPGRIFQDPRSFPLPILYLGVVLGWIRERTGSILPAIVVHGINNLAVLIMSMAARQAT